ncbi:MAG: GTPase Era [Clostridia bacterium]|nr:GTPase Era [Clostridia bacterium]
MIKSGFIAIVGRANAGKSTLLNCLIEQKVSIVSPKPQTTRNRVLGIWTEDDYQMVFVDTPGIFNPKNKLGDYMLKSIDNATKDVDCILAVIDGHDGIDEKELDVAIKYVSTGIPVVAVVTKQDISQKETLINELAKLNAIEGLQSVWVVSAHKNKNVKELREELKKYLKDDVMYFEKDDVTDKSQRFMVCEIIREKILLGTDEEIPHGIGVELNKMEYNPKRDIWSIDANIIIEKASHKPIILGKHGAKIKEIGSYARQSMEKLLGTRVFLQLWVKIKPDWRNSDFMLKEIGYDKKDCQ